MEPGIVFAYILVASSVGATLMHLMHQRDRRRERRRKRWLQDRA